MRVLTPPLRIAVVGGGVAGITAAYLLARRHRVTLFERNAYVGGHTNTITVEDGSGGAVPVDTGFIVCNPRTYPLFYRLLREWGVSLRDSDMSFGYSCERTGLAYVGPTFRDFAGRLANLLKPAFVRMLLEQRRFNRRASLDLARGGANGVTLGAYLDRVGASRYFRDNYLLPLAAAVWSSPDVGMLEFPAGTFLRFFKNHGMLDLHDRPTWQTVVGGSQAYVRAFRARFAGEVVVNAPVRAVRREAGRVIVRCEGHAAATFDRVVMAAHADESLAMLDPPSDAERSLLSAWRYHRNRTVLHTDAAVMPPDRKLWASWNYRRRADGAPDAPVPITYYMNRLQGLACRRDYLVTLNAGRAIDPAKVIYEVEYTHPAYTFGAIEAQRPLRDLNGSQGTYFCGSYLGHGFHEDAVASAVEVAGALGVIL
ncbi:MAG: NAD(P)/FAD-dependent oxidoreductase [Phycisphaerales bacterium]